MIQRYFTKPGQPFGAISFAKRQVVLPTSDKPVVIDSPTTWSDNAVALVAANYLRKRDAQFVGETSIRSAIERIAGAWAYWGNRLGYFNSAESTTVFKEECLYLLAHQMASPNSPQWFNTGIHHSYGIEGPAQGHFHRELQSGRFVPSRNAYERPQAHACFIQSVNDDLVNPGGIMDLWTREARLFKYGSGSGTNFSHLRAEGERLEGGGISSGLMSFLKVGDAAAGAVRSGGTTRRAAKMVILDMDHPEIESFIDWKLREEWKAQALSLGIEGLSSGRLPSRLVDTWKTLGEMPLPLPLHSLDWRGEVYRSVSGQNSNNSVRVSQAFMRALRAGAQWELTARQGGGVVKKLAARDLWDRVGKAAWFSADPGVQFQTAINESHTCLEDGEIRASNPCSEYLFLDDTGCNLASLNLLKFLKTDSTLDLPALQAATRILTIALDITVSMAQYPTEQIGVRSEHYRTLGIGFANLGSTLMCMGLPYGSEQSQALVREWMSLISAEAYLTSAKLAQSMGAFGGFSKNRDSMLRVIRNHARAAGVESLGTLEGVSCSPEPLATTSVGSRLAQSVWLQALELGENVGFRNAQTTAIAPTGTIGLVMDCDTLGVEPEFALSRRKLLADGSSRTWINQSVPRALESIGLNKETVQRLVKHLEQEGTLQGAPGLSKKQQEIFRTAEPTVRGEEALSSDDHLSILSAASPMVSGGISKTLNLPVDCTPKDVCAVYEKAEALGIKALAVYRSESKLSQPLAPVGKEAATGIACLDCG